MIKNIEVELKFPLLNIVEVEKALTQSGKIKNESYQIDHYLTPPHRDFLGDRENINEWLRLRRTNDKVQINYKDWLPHESKLKTHCTEFETTIGSYEDFTNILKVLNFKEIVVVEKKRKVWEMEDVEISIDRVKGLGEFIEIEYKGESTNVEMVRNYLYTFLSKLGAKTEEIDIKGYPLLLLEKAKS